MPRPRGKRTRLTVDRELFEEFFVIDSFGRSIAADAVAMDVIRTPYEAIEMVCVANRRMAVVFVDEMADELEKVGKDDDYITALELQESDRANRLIDEYVSKERHREIFLGVLKEVREELGVPELDARSRKALRLSRADSDEEERGRPDNQPALPDGVEPAFVRIAPWRFEKHFRLSGAGFWVAHDAIRQSVIATPYEAVEMICNVNLMHSARSHENAMRLIFEQYTPEELMVAIQNGTFSGFMERTSKGEKFEEMVDNLMLEIRTKFGVPETEERGTAEKYKMWAESRKKPVN